MKAPAPADRAALRSPASTALAIDFSKLLDWAIVLLIAASYLLVYPVGEYAIDDDWGYVRSLHHLHTTGEVTILDWYQTSTVALLFWGLLFTKALGFSFTITKVSVVVLFCLECLTLARLLRGMGVSAALTGMAVLTLLFNPLHFYHGFLYTTDVPTLAWELLALLFYLKALDADGRRQAQLLWLGSIFGALSFLVRQTGVLVHVAFFLYVLLWERRRLKSLAFWLNAFAPALLLVAAFTYWYRYVHGPTALFTWSEGQLGEFFRQTSAYDVARVAFVLCVYVGLLVFPLSLAVWPGPSRSPAAPLPKSRRAAAGSAGEQHWFGAGLLLTATAAFGMLLYLGIVEGETFPYLRNKITPFGYLRPNEVLLGERDVLWTKPVAWLIGIVLVLSFLAFARLLPNVNRAVPAGPRRRGLRVLLLLGCLQLAYLFLTSRWFFDRHLLLILPTVLLLFCALAEGTGRPNAVAFAVLLLPCAFYGIAGTHDAHAVARRAFIAGEELMSAGIDARFIDAGYAFDGWYMYGRAPEGAVRQARPDDAWWVQHLVPAVRTDYVVATSPSLRYETMAPHVSGPDRLLFLRPSLERYEVYRKHSYLGYWPFGERTMYVLLDRRRTP